MSHSIVRRKISTRQTVEAEGRPGAERAFRLAFARAMRDEMQLSVEIENIALRTSGLGEVLENLPEMGLILVLDGPEGVLGLMVLSNPLLSALVEVQTMGAIQNEPGPPRRPTRTDAAIVSGAMDKVLSGMDQLLADEADLVWAGGYRFASFLDDARPLGLLLDDTNYRHIQAKLRFGARREGFVLLALQAREGTAIVSANTDKDGADQSQHFSRDLADLVVDTQVRMEAVIDRITLPIAEVMELRVGQALSLPQGGIDRISVESVDGRRIAAGKLGQNRGLRALRLTEIHGGGKTDGKAAGLATARGTEPVVSIASTEKEPMQRAG